MNSKFAHTAPTASRPAERLSRLAWALAAGGLLSLLGACGGGGDATTDSTEADSLGTSASATAMASDTGSTADQALDSVLALDSSTLSALSAAEGAGSLAARHQVQSRAPSALAGSVSGTVDCAGGGSIDLTITGPSAQAVINGELDAGEHYVLSYSACQAVEGGVALDGDLSLDVTAADAALTSVTLATGSAGFRSSLSTSSGTQNATTLQGSMDLVRSESGDASGTLVTTTQWSTDSLALTSLHGSRSADYTLSNANATRTATWLAGVLQASSFSGTMTMAASKSNGRAYTVSLSTQSNMTYDADGQPTGGGMTLALPSSTLVLSVANSLATVTVDRGPDGTIDHTYRWPVASWIAKVGE